MPWRRKALEDRIAFRADAGLSDREEEHTAKRAVRRLRDMERELALQKPAGDREAFLLCKAAFDEAERARSDQIAQTDRYMTNSFRFLAAAYGEGQELVLFLSELSEGYHTLQIVRECGNDMYYRYNKLLLLRDRRTDMREKAMELLASEP